MIENRLFVLLFLLGFYGFSQTKGIVVDENNKPIPYVSIWVENETIGTTSDINGQFEIHVSDGNKMLFFSAVGFELQKNKVSEIQKVVMQSKEYQLDEMVIEQPIGKKKMEIGEAGFASTFHHSGKSPWVFAKFFPFKESYSKTKFIKDAIFFTKSSIKNASFKVRVFEVNEDGTPGEDLTVENIIVLVKSGREKTKVDLSSYNLVFPERGVFIGFEWLSIDENKYFLELEADNSVIVNKNLNFAPSLICNYSETNYSYSFRGGRWYKSTRNTKSFFPKSFNKILEPAINLTLTN